jgi:hypothetical protein
MFLFFILFLPWFQAQEENNIIRPGLISGRLTLAPSYFVFNKNSLFYLHGNLEGRLDKNVSLCGDSYFYLGTSGTDMGFFRYHHAGFFGLLFHKDVKNHDFFTGFQPGISYTQIKKDTLHPDLKKPSSSVNALFSVYAGYNLYFYDYFHFFIHARYRYGLHATNLSLTLNEIIFSAGLGFQINTIRKNNSAKISVF